MRLTSVVVVLVVTVSLAASGAGAEEKSLGRAMLYSLLLPGAGEAYMGYNTRAKVAMGTEIVIWSGFALFRYQGGLREDKYKEMARIQAGVEGERDEDYYLTISYYLSNEDYNVDVLREARFLYPDNRDEQLEYWEQNGYFGEEGWAWPTVDAMLDYADVRTDGKKSYRRATLMIGFAVLNRMISTVGLYVSAKQGEEQANLLPRVGYDSRNGGSTYLYVNLPVGR